MTIFILSKVSASLRGHLTRWTLEAKTGIFIGDISSRVREKLWDMVKANRTVGNCTVVFYSKGEQQLKIESTDEDRCIDFDGLTLFRTVLNKTEEANAMEFPIYDLSSK